MNAEQEVKLYERRNQVSAIDIIEMPLIDAYALERKICEDLDNYER